MFDVHIFVSSLKSSWVKRLKSWTSVVDGYIFWQLIVMMLLEMMTGDDFIKTFVEKINVGMIFFGLGLKL